MTGDRPSIASVELLLDAASEAAIRDDWTRLTDVGLSSAGAHTGASNRPHLSLVVRSAIGDPSRLRGLVGGVPLPLTISGLVLFPHGNRTVLARGVVPDAALLDLHRRVAESTGDWGDPLPHSTPGGWTPHITLARRLRIVDLPTALNAVSTHPAGVSAVAIRVWDAASRTITDL